MPEDRPQKVTVVLAWNTHGKVEPFVFEHEAGARLFAKQLVFGDIEEPPLVFPDVEFYGGDETPTLLFGLRRLRATRDGADT